MSKGRVFNIPSGLLVAFLAIGTTGLLRAQQQPVETLLEFADLEQKADEVVKVNLWGRSLDQAKKILSLRKNATGPVKTFMHGLTAVYRRTYRFRGSSPSKEDVAPVHRRLTDNGWVPLIETENRKKPESLSVYSYYSNEEVAGISVVSSDSGEVTLVKIMGPVDLEALSAIGSGLGLPLMNLGSTELGNLSGASGKK